MKRKTDLFLVRHQTLCTVLFTVIFVAIPILLLTNAQANTLLVVFSGILLMFSVILFVSSSAGRLMKKPLEAMERFDPMPLYRETELLLTYPLSKPLRRVVLINHAVALRDMCEYQRAYDILAELYKDKSAKDPLYNQIVLTNNLADICVLLGRFEEADAAYASLSGLCKKASGAIAKSCEKLALNSFVYECMREQRYSDVVSALEGKSFPSVRAQVTSSIDISRAYIKLGEYEKAKERLLYVISCAKDTADAKIAQAMLSDISK